MDPGDPRLTVYQFFEHFTNTLVYAWLPALAVATIFTFLQWMIAALVSLLLRRAGMSGHYARCAAEMARFVTISVAVYYVLIALGFDPNVILSTLGIFSLVIGYALSLMLTNYFGGMWCGVSNVVSPGECVEIAQYKGVVTSTGWLWFEMRNPSTGRKHRIPNSFLSTQVVTVLDEEETQHILTKTQGHTMQADRSAASLFKETKFFSLYDTPQTL